MRPDEEAGNAEREDGDTKADHAHVGGDEDEYPADERDERWNRIEPDPIRAWQVRTGAPEAHHADDLTDELHENSRGDQRVDHDPQREERREDRDHAQDQHRYVRKPFCRMEPAERFEEVTV